MGRQGQAKECTHPVAPGHSCAICALRDAAVRKVGDNIERVTSPYDRGLQAGVRAERERASAICRKVAEHSETTLAKVVAETCADRIEAGPTPARPAQECRFDQFSSRTCELGTRSCVVAHGPAQEPARQGEAQRWGVWCAELEMWLQTTFGSKEEARYVAECWNERRPDTWEPRPLPPAAKGQ